MPKAYEEGACDPEDDPNCDLRDLTYGEMQDVLDAMQTFDSNGCGFLNDFFEEAGWGDRLEMWDAHITEVNESGQEGTLDGDYHLPFDDDHPDHVHIYSDADFETTLAHELLHWEYGYDLSHDEVRDRAEVCSGQQH